MIVTFEPKRANDWPSSAEITPPPRNAMVSGSSRMSQKFSLFKNSTAWSPSVGSRRGPDPVVMMKLSPVTTSSPISTVLASTNLAPLVLM